MLKANFVIPCLIATFMAAGSGMADQFVDSDWDASLLSNCDLPGDDNLYDLPNRDSVFWTDLEGDRKLNIRLRRGDIGGCLSDDRSRHGAPFWERAELQNRRPLLTGMIHEVSFRTTFVKGFRGKRETFFQIHGWSRACRSAPWLMMKFSWRTLKIEVLRGAQDANPTEDIAETRGQLVSVLDHGPTIGDLTGDAQQFVVRLDLTRPAARIEVLLNGEILLPPTEVDHLTCSEPHVKMGIYRPGEVNPGTSHVIFDDVAILSEPETGPL